MTFLQTHLGQPYTANGFYNFFKDAMRKAELPESLALHGLRKAFCCHLAGHPLASIGTLVVGLRCSWCPGSAPMPKLIGLFALAPARRAQTA
jgi:hypothetical protein